MDNLITKFKYPSLTPKQISILVNKKTEIPNTGKYISKEEIDVQGTFLCRGCGLPLFEESARFSASCGWPSFDDQIKKNVNQLLDADQIRTEITCKRCDGHLGHVFTEEKYTNKNTRYCVNSIAIEFTPHTKIVDTKEILVAAGCFWGVEELFKNHPAVLITEVGYSGGSIDFPSYDLVCKGKTNHKEVVRIVFDTQKATLLNMYKYFFEIHNFEQIDGQGPDLGSQYLSYIFYYDEKQLKIAQSLIDELKKLNYRPITSLESVKVFWPAELYHQSYYEKNGKVPYCHIKRKIF